MAFIQADRVRDTTTTTGTGTITVTGTAPTGFRALASVLSVGDSCFYTIAAQGGADWEVGIGTLQSSTTLSRDVVLSSSNAGSLVSLAAGTKDVFMTIPAAELDTLGQTFAITRGFALN